MKERRKSQGKGNVQSKRPKRKKMLDFKKTDNTTIDSKISVKLPTNRRSGLSMAKT